MIETDTSIAPGSSGGALTDSEGDVIGITTSMAATDQQRPGVGFATPIDVGHDVADQLIASGRVTHPWMGVEADDVDGMTAGALGILGGALVQKVVSNSPAAKAGVQTSDVIVQVNDQIIRSLGVLVTTLRGLRPGDKIIVRFFHDRSERTVTIVLTERPSTFS
jgi:putative serine protease PepD